MKKVKFLYDKVMEITGQVGKDHVGAYAAQAAYFFMLSLIPIILLLITLVQYTPVTKADVMTAVLQVFPKSVDSLITSIVNQVYNQSGGIIHQEGPIDSSNVMYVHKGQATRVGIKMDGDKKVRYAKSTGEVID